MDDLIGVPFAYGGRGPDSFDCYGLIMECARRAGKNLPDFGFASDQALISAMMGSTMPQWQETEPGPGAVVLIRIGRLVSHVGYMLNADHMIHAWHKTGGVTIERIDTWQPRIVGFYRYVG